MSYFSSKKIKNQGFTLIELMVVFAIVALLSSIAVPKYFTSLQKSRESVLRYDLSVMRESIDKYFSDNGSYPESLQQLVEKKYLKNIPKDPIAQANDLWIILPPVDGLPGSVYDIKSGAQGQATDGSNFADW
ncbi:type II secretion system protein [Limnohabitans sp. Jir72]|uniref:type II secretion system protein n=1 Tax=Limnohabitans sp. Jir72 TaxID=1977909 RepID=UPI000D33F91D|nr:prepilin-type N-terminal cleavage/methylation domain-containing protein [Limnohabitans sp. Jir72]PUE26445.1 type II secretion system protein G [Limnohabitans sp. Jir72]